LRVVAVSGSALPGGLATRFMDGYGDVLYNLYGSTEASWVSIATPNDLRRAPGTAGRPPHGTKVAILDEEGKPLPEGKVGRIFVSNDMLFEGYTSGATAQTHEGLLSTGDLGHVDDGLLFVDGREDDMIISGGENVFPSEVEDLLAGLPQVREVAVVGVSDTEFGQRLAAYLALHPGERLDADAVREYVHHFLARFSVPRDVYFVHALPRNATGKVVTRELPYRR
jgi:acyl-CoA synthetase (AMP-forming)/AMP-acid ligase II